MVLYKHCALFQETSTVKFKSIPGLIDAFRNFQRIKSAEPTQPVSKSDTHFVSGGPFKNLVPNLKHAHLTQDISVFYSLEGKNPHIIKLYGIFSHAESGTGTPPNIKLQKIVAKKCANQVFD